MNENTDATVALSAKQLKAIGAGIISAFIFAGSIGGSGIIRVDRFGLADYNRLEKEHTVQMEHRMKVLEFQIRRDMPPAATKARIRALERCLERQCQDFEPATTKWQ